MVVDQVGKPFIALIAVLAIVPPASAQKNCPTIDGRHTLDKTVDGKARRFAMAMYTRNEGGLFSYAPASLTDPDAFHRADGVWRPITIRGRSGKAKVSCSGANTVHIETSADDGGSSWSKLTPIDQCRVRYETDLAIRSGVYSKC